MSNKPFEVLPPTGAEVPAAAQKAQEPKTRNKRDEADALALANAEIAQLKAQLAASHQQQIETLTKRIEELEAGKKAKPTPKAELKTALVTEEGEDLLPVDVDLAPNARFLLIDGTAYQHGLTYYVTSTRAQTINEMASRTWSHEQEIGLARRGPSSNFQNRPIERNYNTKTHGSLVQASMPAPSLEGVAL